MTSKISLISSLLLLYREVFHLSNHWKLKIICESIYSTLPHQIANNYVMLSCFAVPSRVKKPKFSFRHKLIFCARKFASWFSLSGLLFFSSFALSLMCCDTFFDFFSFLDATILRDLFVPPTMARKVWKTVTKEAESSAFHHQFAGWEEFLSRNAVASISCVPSQWPDPSRRSFLKCLHSIADYFCGLLMKCCIILRQLCDFLVWYTWKNSTCFEFCCLNHLAPHQKITFKQLESAA